MSLGLVVPGTKGVRVANGSAYGVGIYLSSEASYSVNYSVGTGRLLVCAALVGDRHKDCSNPVDHMFVFKNAAQVCAFVCRQQPVPSLPSV